MSNIPKLRKNVTKATIDKLRYDSGVCMARKMEVPGHSVDLEESFHSAAFFILNILHNSFIYLLTV